MSCIIETGIHALTGCDTPRNCSFCSPRGWVGPNREINDRTLLLSPMRRPCISSFISLQLPLSLRLSPRSVYISIKGFYLPLLLLSFSLFSSFLHLLLLYLPPVPMLTSHFTIIHHFSISILFSCSSLPVLVLICFSHWCYSIYSIFKHQFIIVKIHMPWYNYHKHI